MAGSRCSSTSRRFSRLVDYVVGGDDGEEEKRLTNREWWATYGPRFEETDRELLERIGYDERRIAQREARAAEAKEDAAEVDLVRQGR